MNGTNPVVAKLGRRLRLGVVGGGGEALIGPVHRRAARLDDLFEIRAGVLSADPERSLAQAAALGLPKGYGTVGELLAAVREGREPLDAVAVMTPNDSHAPIATAAVEAGLHVICDKPLTNDLAGARRLARAVRARGAIFCLTHNYSGYPMVRQARAMVAAGEIGPLRLVTVSYLQGSLGIPVEATPEAMPARLRWRLDPARGGISHVMGDIGTHAHQLATFVTGRRVESVMADIGALLPGRQAHDTGMALLAFAGGAKGTLLATKVATGALNGLTIEVFGEGGGLSWSQASCNDLTLRRYSDPATVFTRGGPGLHPLARRATRLPAGHPEGFEAAFANLYADFAEVVAARLAGVEPDPLALHFPDIETGVEGLAFIDAALRSTAEGRWVAVEGTR